jgi:glycosyltransferase involved in cell wall biosynthesis
LSRISVVSPVYKAKLIVPELVRRIIESVSKITEDFEIILVEDGCPENSWEAIAQECQKDKRIKGIKLSRNFGQHYAITAGLDYVKGDWVVVMDCDLQDQPEEIEKMYNLAITGYHVVLGQRKIRYDSYFKKSFSFLFYRFLNFMSGINHDETIANFGIYHKEVIATLIKMREPNRFFPTMINWIGFNQTKIEIEHAERKEGTSNYNFSKLMKLAIDIILSNSEKPLKLFTLLGIVISLTSLLIAFIFLIQWSLGDIKVLGYTSLIISIWLLSGIILATLGIVGLYIGKTFETVKNRPIYIIQDKING